MSGGVRDHVSAFGLAFFLDEFLFAPSRGGQLRLSADDILTCDLALGGDLAGLSSEFDTYYSSDLYDNATRLQLRAWLVE